MKETTILDQLLSTFSPKGDSVWEIPTTLQDDSSSWSRESEMFEPRSCCTDDALWEPGDDSFEPISSLNPDVSWPGWHAPENPFEKIKSPKLTDAESGLYRSRGNYNLAEVAQHLLDNNEFCKVGSQLALYRPPCWRILESGEPTREAIASLLDAETNRYLDKRKYAEIIDKLRIHPQIHRLQRVPDVDPHAIVCRDGIYRWPDGSVTNTSSRGYRFGYLEVFAEDIQPSPTPYFDQFMDNVAGDDKNLYQLLIEVLGVIITGYPAKSFFVFEGASDSGKSELCKFLELLLGETSCWPINDIDDLAGKFEMGRLPGKLLCICADASGSIITKKAKGIIKQISGGDTMRGEDKGKDAFSFHSTAKLLFVSNFPLSVSGKADQGFQRRLVIVPFVRSVPREHQIPEIHKLMYCEAGGIIWKLLQSMVEFEEKGGMFTHIGDGCNVFEAIPTPEERMQNFIEMRCSIEEQEYLSAKELYSAFTAYDQEVNPNAESISENKFGRLMRHFAPQITARHSCTGQRYCGISLRHG